MILAAYDDGAGALVGLPGSVNYVGGSISVTPIATRRIPLPVYEQQPVGTRESNGVVTESWREVFKGVEYQDKTLIFKSGGTVKVRYRTAGTGTQTSQSVTWQPTLDLTPGYAEPGVPGSLRMTIAGDVVIDRQGKLYASVDPATGAGTEVGTIEYQGGVCTFTGLIPGRQNTAEISHLLTTLGGEVTDEITFRTASAPLRPGTLILQFVRAGGGGTITVTAQTTGAIVANGVEGHVDVETGICRVRFGERVADDAAAQAADWYNADNVEGGMAWKPGYVLTETIRYAAVAYSYIPLDKNILGIDPVRLPTDGRVPIFRVGDVAVLHHTDNASISTLTVPQTIDVGRTRLSRVWLFDEGNSDTRVPTTHYTADLDAGTVTLTDATGLTGPIRIEHRIEDMALISDAQINGQLTFTRPITHDYPALTTGVSSALVIGDLQSRATKPFDQQTWTDEWSDDLIGNATTAGYNSTTYPIIVDNQGAITERWALIFDDPTTVRVIGESVGQIATLSIANEIAPINPNTGVPYFRIDPRGWGSGWSAGNVSRHNTIGANYPVWITRTTQQGPASGDTDGFRIQIRGDADAV